MRSTKSYRKPNLDVVISDSSPASNNYLYLYTKGGHFSLDGVDYVGEYHYAGRTPKTGPVPEPGSRILRRVYRNPDDYIYDHLHNFDVEVLRYRDPKQIVYKPTEQLYTAGYDTRYFVEKIQDDYSYAIEIDVEQYNNIGTRGGIDPNIYPSAAVRWKLTGTQEGIFDHNRLQVYRASTACPSIDYAIKNYLEHARITLV